MNDFNHHDHSLSGIGMVMAGMHDDLKFRKKQWDEVRVGNGSSDVDGTSRASGRNSF